MLASLASLLAFSPWILVIISNPPTDVSTNWTKEKSTILSASIRWAGIVSRAFLDLGISPEDSLKRLLPLVPLILSLLALIIYSIYFLYRRTHQWASLFVLTLIAVPGLAFIIPDFIFGRRYGTTRFITPCILGIQLSLAYLLATQTTSFASSNRRQNVWQLIAFMLISGGILSCAISSQAEIWWNKAPDKNKYYPQIADIVNRTTQPLLLKDGDLIPVQTLSYLLDPKVQFQLVRESEIPKIPDSFSDVFLFQPSDSLRSGIERLYDSQVRLIYGTLWKLEIRDNNTPDKISR
jgi:uncharacterized membrane protein